MTLRVYCYYNNFMCICVTTMELNVLYFLIINEYDSKLILINFITLICFVFKFIKFILINFIKLS